MHWKLIATVLILPGSALVYIPAIILWAAAGTPAAAVPPGVADPQFWCGVVLAAIGFAFACWTVRLFVVDGGGTPAPWEPPKRFVASGPYRHVRNPMISSVVVLQGAESLLAGSWPLAIWMLVFVVVNTAYFLLREEPGLERRFGEEYLRYKANVPRWIPRLSPWEGR